MLVTRSVAELLRKAITPGALVFDVGACCGDKSARYLDLGARVVCIEPLSANVSALRSRFGQRSDVEIVAKAAYARGGTGTLFTCTGKPHLSTLSVAWMHGRFKDEQWRWKVKVPVTTLDALVAKHGLPAFCKIDVEGSEREVLTGLTHPIPALSIEFARESARETAACLGRLSSLGFRHFNLALGEGDGFAFPRWVEALDILATIESSADPLAWGDVYAVLQ